MYIEVTWFEIVMYVVGFAVTMYIVIFGVVVGLVNLWQRYAKKYS